MNKKNDMIQLKIDMLIEAMGKSLFLKLVRFLVEIRESEYQVKVLMTRRLFDVYLALNEIIDYLYDGEVHTRGKIVTNLSAVLVKDIKEKSILIVDDIVLHGRALNEVYTYLTETCGCEPKKIDLKVFLRNKDTELIPCEATDKLSSYVEVPHEQWRWISSCIVNAFAIVGQPYISYLPSAELELNSDAATSVLQFVDEQNVDEITSDLQEYCGVKSYLYIFDDVGKTILDSASLCNMVRIYVYEKISKIVVIPYVFLNPLNSSMIKELAETILQREEIMFKSDMGFRFVEDVSEQERYICCLTTYLMSMVLGVKFFEKLGISQIIWSKHIEHISLGCEVNLQSDKIDDLLSAFADKQFYTKRVVNFEESSDMQQLVSDIYGIDEQMEIDTFMNLYLKMSGKRDEVLARQNKKRMNGIESLRLSCIIKQYVRNEFWKKMISVIDSGQGTLTMARSYIDGQCHMDSLLFAGEQNPTCNEQNLICIVYPLMQYEASCRLNDKPVEVTCKKEIANKILNHNSVLKERLKGENIDEFIEQDILETTGQYYVKRVAIYENSAILKEALKLEKEYEITRI